MKITDAAIEAILNIMTKKGLDPKDIFLEIMITDKGNLGISFTKEPFGTKIQIGNLNVVVESTIDTTLMTVDYGEVGNKKGLVFLGEVNETNS